MKKSLKALPFEITGRELTAAAFTKRMDTFGKEGAEKIAVIRTGTKAAVQFYGIVHRMKLEAVYFHDTKLIADRPVGRPKDPASLRSIFALYMENKGSAFSTPTAFRALNIGERIVNYFVKKMGWVSCEQTHLRCVALASMTADELPPKMRREQAALFDVAELKTKSGWTDYDDVRALNRPGYTPNAENLRGWLKETYPENPELHGLGYDNLPGEVQARFRKEGKRYKDRRTAAAKALDELEQRSRAKMATISADMRGYLEERPYVYGTVGQVKELVETLHDLWQEVKMFAEDRQHKSRRLKQ